MYNNSEREEPSNSENFVIFGTAFPETTEKDRRAGRSDAGQFVPLWKQEARDEKGRRRFHGAFTGGFSAGYYNTVGSKEGWEPSSYVSSRESRTERREARPEDFMDEEDLQELEGARKLVTTEEFDILGGTERELAARRKELEADQDRGSGVGFLGASLLNMFGPPTDSLGVRLLRKMGWKPGQGIGPRVKRRRDDDDEDDDDYMNNVEFAPRDTPIENYQPKRDTYGLGYDLSASVPEIAEMKRLRELARKEQEEGGSSSKHRSSFGVFDNKKTAGRDAFGLGAFEDDDDDDVYGDSSSSRGNNYHHALYDDEGGYTRDQLKHQSKKMKQKEERSSNKVRCSDNRLPLDGFAMANQNQQIGKWYAPPKVPSDFNEKHVPDTNQSTPTAKISQDSTFSFEERGRALGETAIEQRSVFDYMPKHSKDRLDQLLHSVTEEVKDKSQLADFPIVTKEVANLALRGFIPFGDNPKKQDRYRDYLENMAGKLTEDGAPKKVLPIPQGLSYEAGMKELDEFAKAARIFRPISQMMEGRFTSATATSKNIETVSFEGGLKTEEQYRKEKEVREKELNREPEKKQLSQEAEAAAMNMFGGLTRTIKPFYPNRLVCKRFNVRNPHPDHDPNAKQGRTQAGSRDALSKETVDSMLNERLPLKFESSSKPETPTTEDPLLSAVIPKPSDRSSSDSPAPPKNVGVEKEVTTTKDEELPDLDYERPSMDIFKAIFDGSDDDEEEEEEEEEMKKPVQASKEIVQTQNDDDDDEDDFIGPPVPPKAPTAEIELTTSSNAPEPFRPMFKRASERKEHASIPAISSEEVVVQPFKSRHTQRRRRVSLSEDERDKSSDDDRHHSKRHKSSKDRSSKDRSSKDKDRRDRKERKDKHKKRDRSKDRKSKHRHKSKRKYEEEEEDEFEGMWVEKEPVKDTSSSSKRKRASDLW